MPDRLLLVDITLKEYLRTMRPQHAIFVLLAALLATATSCLAAAASSDIPGPAYVRPGSLRTLERTEGLAGLANLGRVAEGIYRGAQPAPEGYTSLKGMGIRTVINLNTAFSEKAAVEAAGMRSIEIPVEFAKKGSRAKVDQVVALMADPANQPVFVHCSQGQDRTGIVVAAYRLKERRWPQIDAEAEMEFFWLDDARGVITKFIRQYGNDMRKRK